MNKTLLIALGGYARTGKDTMYEIINKYATEILRVPCCKMKFANALREEVRDRCMAEFGIDSFTEDPNEKEVIRPLLVEVGKKRREEDEDYWARSVLKLDNVFPEGIVVITDLRFENEARCVMERDPNAKILMLEKPGIGPANSEEATKTSPLYRTLPVYKWESFSGKPWEELNDEEKDSFFADTMGVVYLLTRKVSP